MLRRTSMCFVVPWRALACFDSLRLALTFSDASDLLDHALVNTCFDGQDTKAKDSKKRARDNMGLTDVLAGGADGRPGEYQIVAPKVLGRKRRRTFGPDPTATQEVRGSTYLFFSSGDFFSVSWKRFVWKRFLRAESAWLNLPVNQSIA